jgi:hypothetical protein
VGIALAYRGNLSAGETLRLSPSRRSWLVYQQQLQMSEAETSANTDTDPSANGPWAAVENPPSGNLRLLCEALDHSLWCALEDHGNWSLQRYDGSQFIPVTQGLPAAPFHCLHSHGSALYLGTELGLYRCSLFPDEGQPYALEPVPAVPEAIRAIDALPGQRLACAGDDGLAILDAQGALDARLLSGVGLQAVHARRAQLYLATPQALLLFDQGRWFRYEGAALSENLPDWQPLEPADIGTAVSPLPGVRLLADTGDGSLWLGTERGLARYYARQGRSTLLEAFPDLGTGRIHCLQRDDRGMLWVAGEDGLFRFDGRDLAQHDFAESRWQSLGLAASIYPDDLSENPRGHWRYNQGETRWEQYDSRLSRFGDPKLDLRQQPSNALQGLLLTASVRAQLGQFDGSQFTPQADLDWQQLAMRVKPTQERIVDGGLPALPAYCEDARWRYLQLETMPLEVPATGRPWWSREGRLFPPPEQSGPFPGHFRTQASSWNGDGRFDKAVFAYPPSARLWMEYRLPPKVGIRIRLFKSTPAQKVDPALIERVWALLVRAKPAGVPLELAVEGRIVKGEQA